MTEPQKQKIIDEVLSQFDFERVHAIIKWKELGGPIRVETIDELRYQAKNLLSDALDHTDRDTWWIRRGCLMAMYDEKWGLSLFCVPFSSRLCQAEMFLIKRDGELKPEENAELQNEIIRLRAKLRDFGCEL